VDVTHFPDDPLPTHWRTPILALGNFDGLHRGHMKIVERVRRGAIEHGVTPVVLTFDPHPTRVIRPDKAPKLLMTLSQKIETIAQAEIAGVAVVRFTPALSLWSPDEFVERVLVNWLGVSEVWVGANFLFGHNRAGDSVRLRALGAQWGFRAEKIDPVRYKDVIVSSTAIRLLVSEGRVDEASALLGRQYFVDGEVVPGDGRGRVIGFPTANLRTANELIPPRGVYATVARIGHVMQPAVTNIGVRPTFGDGSAEAVETHMLDRAGDLYGEPLRLHFVKRLREERAFPSVDALQAQIALDCRQARALFENVSV
jgi:riboflavin kinase/FMN adenylyltransferase